MIEKNVRDYDGIFNKSMRLCIFFNINVLLFIACFSTKL